MANDDVLNMVKKKIEEKIFPYTLNNNGINTIKKLILEYDIEEIFHAIEIAEATYLVYNSENEVEQDSAKKFLSKIPGVLYNNSLGPIENKKNHIKNYYKKIYNYWNNEKADFVLQGYIDSLFNLGYTEEEIVEDLNKYVLNKLKGMANNWTEWNNILCQWTEDQIKQKNNKEQEEKNMNKKISNGVILSFAKKYKVIKQIGAGSFGITHLVKEETIDKDFILKEFSAERLNEDENIRFFNKFIEEIKFLFDVHHQNIVSIYDYCIKINDHCGFYIMEYIKGTNIEEYIKNNPNSIKSLLRQVIEAFKYLEEKKICHRDIRPNNILVTDEGTVKIIDFGFVKNIDSGKTLNATTRLIDYYYEYPEELRKKKQTYDIKTDMYFIGMLFNDLIKKYNINANGIKKIINKMCQDKPENRYGKFMDIKL